MNKHKYSMLTAALNRFAYAVFIIAEIIAALSVITGLISLIYKLVLSEHMPFLYGNKGNIFVIAVIIMISSAVISNRLDRIEAKQKNIIC